MSKLWIAYQETTDGFHEFRTDYGVFDTRENARRFIDEMFTSLKWNPNAMNGGFIAETGMSNSTVKFSVDPIEYHRER